MATLTSRPSEYKLTKHYRQPYQLQIVSVSTMDLFIMGNIIIILYLVIEIGDVDGIEYKSVVYYQGDHHWMEMAHAPWRWLPEYPVEIKGEKIHHHRTESPDFRFEEDAWLAYKQDWWLEENRPYRISPWYKQNYRWRHTKTGGWYRPQMREDVSSLGCYCTTVYKVSTVLAGCAVVTSRHILTTASSTEVVLKGYRHWANLENLLGAWYDNNLNTFNSSMYMTPARIHYHPRYTRPENVNISHPFPFMFDLSVWAATRTFFNTGRIVILPKAVVCQRGAPAANAEFPSTPRAGDLAHIVGFQFVKAQRKNPMPWFRYVVRTRNHYFTCPKVEWGWFHCIKGQSIWSKYGLDSGAAWHRQDEGRRGYYNGLIGLCAFSMRLRSEESLVHYFTVLNTHTNLEFMYNAYMGLLPYEYLDSRFLDTRGAAPKRAGSNAWTDFIAYFEGYPTSYEHYKETYEKLFWKPPLPWY